MSAHVNFSAIAPAGIAALRGLETYVDDHISGAGAVGLWTKSDSVTAFDDFSFTSR